MAHEFLSDDWFDAVESLRADADASAGALAGVVVNLRVTDGPNGDIDSTLNGGLFAKGATEGAPTTVSVPYDVAKSLLVQGDRRAAMRAFVSGKIKVEGDMAKLMSLQSGGTGPAQAAIQQQLVALTA